MVTDARELSKSPLIAYHKANLLLGCALERGLRAAEVGDVAGMSSADEDEVRIRTMIRQCEEALGLEREAA